jgi:hypothetical protein
MAIKPREEAKAVFPGEVGARILAGSRFGIASRFATYIASFFIDVDVKAALDELVSSAQTGGTPAQYRHRFRHFSSRKLGVWMPPWH